MTEVKGACTRGSLQVYCVICVNGGCRPSRDARDSREADDVYDDAKLRNLVLDARPGRGDKPLVCVTY